MENNFPTCLFVLINRSEYLRNCNKKPGFIEEKYTELTEK